MSSFDKSPTRKKAKRKTKATGKKMIVYRLAQLPLIKEVQVDNQVAAPTETRTLNLHRANSRSQRVRMEGWRQW
jgi:hypothetical protein